MSQKRILVADDEERYRNDFKRYFESLGYAVDTAQNYVGVRELLDNHDYTLIVSDNGMPLGGESRPDRTCGLQLLAHAKLSRKHKETPFVLNTGDDTAETMRLVKEFGGVYRHKDDKTPARELFEKLLGA